MHFCVLLALLPPSTWGQEDFACPTRDATLLLQTTVAVEPTTSEGTPAAEHSASQPIAPSSPSEMAPIGFNLFGSSRGLMLLEKEIEESQQVKRNSSSPLLTLETKGHVQAEIDQQSQLALFNFMQSGGANIALMLILFGLLCTLILFLFGRAEASDIKEDTSPPCRALPDAHIPHYYARQPRRSTSRPVTKAPPTAGISQQARFIPELRLPVPTFKNAGQNASRLASARSRRSGTTSRSASPSPRTHPAYAQSASSNIYQIMTARPDGSTLSVRTPSPFRSSVDTSNVPSPRHSIMSGKSFPETTPENPSEMLGAHVKPIPLSMQTPRDLQTPRVARQSTASQEGVMGVAGLVQWFNVGTPRPPEAASCLPRQSQQPQQEQQDL